MKKIKIALMIVTILALVGCGNANEVIEVEEVSTIVPVEVEMPQKGSVSNDTIIVGKLEANDVALVSPKILGTEEVLKVNYQVGDEVKEGDILVVLDSEATKDQIESARLAYLTTKSNYETLVESIETAKANLERTKELYESGVATKQQLEAAELQASDAQLKPIQSQIRQSLFAYENAKKGLENAVILSPIDGVVSSMNFKENNLATTQSTITITDITSLDINLYVTENIINKVTTDSKILVEIESAGNELIESKIKYVNSVADERTGLYNVKISVDNNDGIYKSGMFARVFITLNSSEFALLVPVDAVLNDVNGNYVYVAKDEKVIRKNVEIGLDNGEVVEILNGLSLEDLIIVKGQNYINESSEIRVVGGN